MQGSTPLPKKWWQKIKPDCLPAKKKTTHCGHFLWQQSGKHSAGGRQVVAFVSLVQ